MNPFKGVSENFANTFKAKPERPVRYMFPFAAAFAVLLGASAITSVDSSYVSLFSNVSTVEVDQRISLDILAYAHTPVNAVDVTLHFDADVFEVAEVNRGNSVISLWTTDPIISEDTIIFRGGTFRNGFLAEHNIATVEFIAIGTGRAKFTTSDVTFIAGDGEGTVVKTTDGLTSEASVFAFDDSVDPEVLAEEIGSALTTDLNDDDKISLSDVSIFMSAWAGRTRVYDFNGDNKMTFTDFSILLAEFVTN